MITPQQYIRRMAELDRKIHEEIDNHFRNLHKLIDSHSRERERLWNEYQAKYIRLIERHDHAAKLEKQAHTDTVDALNHQKSQLQQEYKNQCFGQEGGKQ